MGFKPAENTHYTKKVLNKNSSELNFEQKDPQAHMCISTTSGASGLQRLICLNSYNVQKWETFTFGLKAAKNTHHTKKKALNKSSSELNFEQKSPQTHMSISNTRGARCSKD